MLPYTAMKSLHCPEFIWWRTNAFLQLSAYRYVCGRTISLTKHGTP